MRCDRVHHLLPDRVGLAVPEKASLQAWTRAGFLAEPPSICSRSVNLSWTTMPLEPISNSLMLLSCNRPLALKMTRARLSALSDSTCLREMMTSISEETQKSEGSPPSLVRAVTSPVIPSLLNRDPMRLMYRKNSYWSMAFSRLVRLSTMILDGLYSGITFRISAKMASML